MKGETNEAIRILTKVSNEGDQEDKEEAFFYLGKIQELAGNNSSSNFYYKQSLDRTTATPKAYWLAERSAATSNQPENLLKSPLVLKSLIKERFGTKPTYIQLQDESIKKIEDDKLVNINVSLPESAKILNISSQGIWYKVASEDSLVFKPFHANKAERSYPISGIKGFFANGDEVIVQDQSTLTLLNKKGIKTQISQKYDGCVIEGVFKATNEYILNCPDNAIHFITVEDGTETRTIAQFDVIKKVLADRNNLYLVSSNYLYCYIPKRSNAPLWKIAVGSVEYLFMFEKNIVLLEASGRIALIDPSTGFTRVTVRSDASAIHTLAEGTLGLFTSEGAITAVDTLLRPLWHFNFAKPIEHSPIYTNGNIYLYFGDRKLQSIAPRYYGKRPLQSEIMAKKAAQLSEEEEWDELPSALDSLFKLEPGNAEGWFFKALFLEKKNGSDKEKQKAWSEAVRLSVSNPLVTNLILNRYGKAIGAKFVSLLPTSPKTRYPQFFSNKKNLFTIDPSADRLLCINVDNGELRWSRNVGKLDNSPVIANDENTLAIASGYNLAIYDLNKDFDPTIIQLPGKAFEAKVYNNATYISTWNGFLLKILRSENKLAWSRKIFSVPFLISKNDEIIHVSNLDGEIVDVDDNAGQTREGSSRKIMNSITHLASTDSILVAASGNNRLYIFNKNQGDKPPVQILQEASIVSLQITQDQGENRILIGLADQSILLYTETGAPLWKFQGKNSIFTKPYVRDGEAWIDQGNEVVGISLKDGKTTRKFSTPGGAGTPFIMNKTMFSASPKRLLYGFNL